MRDIRQDLRDRIAALDAQIDPLRKQVATLENKREAMASLLESEESEWKAHVAPVNGHSGAHPAPLIQDVIKDLLADGDVWSGSAIAAVAVKKGCDFKGRNPNRSTHFTLVGLSRGEGGFVEKAGYGKWRLKNPRTKGTTITLDRSPNGL